MQAPSINYWMMLVGVAAAACMIVGSVWWQRRWRRRRGERPPISRKLLRPPGYTLSLQLDVGQEKLLDCLAIAVGSGAGLALLVTVLMPIVFNGEVRAWIAANGVQHSLFSRQLLPGVLSITLLLLGCFCGLAESVARLARVLPLQRVADDCGRHGGAVQAIAKRSLEETLGAVDRCAVEVLARDAFAIQKGPRQATVFVAPRRQPGLWAGRGRGRADLRPGFEALGKAGARAGERPFWTGARPTPRRCVSRVPRPRSSMTGCPSPSNPGAQWWPGGAGHRVWAPRRPPAALG